MRGTLRGNGHLRQQDIMHGAVDGHHLSNADASAGIDCGIPLVIRVTITGPAVTLSIPFRCQVLDSWVILSAAGGASDTITLTNGSDDIAEINCNGSDKDIKAADSIDDDFNTIAKDGSLVVTPASGAVGLVNILVIKVA